MTEEEKEKDEMDQILADDEPSTPEAEAQPQADDQAPAPSVLDDHLNHPRPDETSHHDFNPGAEEANEDN